MVSGAPQIEWVKPPRQARSHKTLERILDAAEALLIEKGAEAMTVAEVARRARSSVGSLYARFSGKDALLISVFERFLEQATATANRALDPTLWQRASLATIIEQTTAFTVRVFEERRHLIASLTIYAARSARIHGVVERLGNTIGERYHALLCARGAAVAHPDPARAALFTTWMLLSALEANSLHNPGGEPTFSSEEIAAETARMFRAYMGVAESAPAKG